MAKLHFYYSAMNAGKSTTLLQSSHNYQERGMDTLLFVPAVDDRAGVGVIGTRIGIEAQANCFMLADDLFQKATEAVKKNKNIKCVLIDEAQFLSKAQVYQCCRITDDLNIPVLAYGLRTDFRAEPFEGSMYLLALADVLIEIKTICHCGSKAIMNMRIDDKGNKQTVGNQVEIGGNDKYVATCRKHFWLGEGFKSTSKENQVAQPIETSI